MIKGDLEDQKKWILGGVLILIVLLVYQRFFLGPAWRKASSVFSEVRVLKQNLKATQASLAKLPQMEADLGRLRKKAKELELSFPSRSELPELLEHLSKVAEKSAVKLIEISPTKTPGTSSSERSSNLYEELPIGLTAKSGYHELGVFINQLENSERLFKVKEIEIRSDHSDSKRHYVKLVVETFVR